MCTFNALNLQIPREQSLHGEDGLYEEVEDTKYSVS